MSNAVSALKGAVSTDGIAQIAEAPVQGMMTLRGDLGLAAVKKAATGVAGVAMPGPGQVNVDGAHGIAWMSPDELLVLCPYETVAQNLDKMNGALAKAHALVVDVSDARAMFQVTGACARDVMAKLAPVDFAPAAFSPGMFRRSRMAQVPAAFWLADDDTFHIVCFRSHAQYMFDLLNVAAQKGSAVGYFQK